MTVNTDEKIILLSPSLNPHFDWQPDVNTMVEAPVLMWCFYSVYDNSVHFTDMFYPLM